MVKRYPSKHAHGMNIHEFQRQQRLEHERAEKEKEVKAARQRACDFYVGSLTKKRTALYESIVETLLAGTEGFTYTQKKNRNKEIAEKRAEIEKLDREVALVRGYN